MVDCNLDVYAIRGLSLCALYQERSQIRITRGLGVLLNGQVVHITDMNSKAQSPAILPQAEDPYLAIEDSVVLNLDLHRRDYHVEKTGMFGRVLCVCQ